MKSPAVSTRNWKILALIAGLILSTTLTSCSTASPDATQQGDAMKGDAMKDKGGATPTPPTKP